MTIDLDAIRVAVRMPKQMTAIAESYSPAIIENWKRDNLSLLDAAGEENQPEVQVRYIQNVTDIDDDVLRKAKQVGKDWRSLGNERTRRFIDDMRALNVRRPDEYPRATDVMSDIVRTDHTSE